MNQVFNPFLPLYEYIPDGEPHVFNNRVYLFGSHDKEGGDTFCMLDYAVYSASVYDLKTWHYEGIIYHASQDPLYSPERPYMYAPDVVQGNDGRYYLYYCLSGKFGIGGYHGPVSVAVCDTPAGQYQYLGFVRNPDGSPMKTYVCFDPAVINDNGTIRLYYGTQYPYEEQPDFRENQELIRQECEMFGKTEEEILNTPDSVMGACVCVLEDDMLTVREAPKHIIPYAVKNTEFEEHPFFEAASMRKVGRKYYFIYSSQQNHELCYAVSDYPDKDFHFGGTIVSNGDIGYHGRKPEDRLNMTGTTHGSIIQIQNQWYVFYHRLTHKSDYSRQACAEQIHFLPDGSIPQVEITSCGLNGGALTASGAYPAVIACNITNGHMPHGSNSQYQEHFPHVTHEENNRFIAEISNHTLIGYKYFKFEENQKNYKLKIRYQATGEGSFQIFTDISQTQKLSEIPVSPCTVWTEASALLPELHGVFPLYLVYSGAGEAKLIEIEFSSETFNPEPKKEQNNQSAFFMALSIVAGAGIFLAGASLLGNILNAPDVPESSDSEKAVIEEIAETLFFPPSATETEAYRTGKTTTTSVSDKSFYEEDEYAVGTDIPAGKYLAVANNYTQGDFYFGVYSEPYKSSEDTRQIAGGWQKNYYYVQISDGQYLHFSHSKLYPEEEILTNPSLKDLKSHLTDLDIAGSYYMAGDYEIGKDIPAGKYRAVPSRDNPETVFYFGIYDQPYVESENTPEIGGGWQDGSYDVELQKGQYISFSWAYLYPVETMQETDTKKEIKKPYELYQNTSGFYSEGDYQVGTDIPAGLYIAVSDGSNQYGDFNFSVYDKPYTENSGINAVNQGNYQNNYYIQLEENQYIHFSHAKLYSLPESYPELDPCAYSGMFKVYHDNLTAGIYTLIADSDYAGQYAVYDAVTADAQPLLYSNYIEQGETVEVPLEEEQYLLTKFCHVAEKSYPEGNYTVGKELPAGLYAAVYTGETFNDEFLLEVSSPQKGMLIGGYSHKCRYVELKDGDTVNLKYATLYQASYTRHMPNPFGNDGMYWVGHDLPAGTYTVTSSDADNASMCIIYDNMGENSDIISAQKIDSDTQITLHDGEFIEMRGCFLLK